MNTKASNKAKKHNYIPLGAKTIQKIKKKHRCWTRYRETGDKKKYQEYAKTRNQVKSAIIPVTLKKGIHTSVIPFEVVPSLRFT
jgi:histidinol-phosphate/aromatic aminotransferase/cobyric acid decarboxylase-like protein